MAEEGIILPVTPESTKSDGGNSRRNSMGKSTSFNSGEKVLPHYLRASTGSCHDLCKYGRKHTFEAKARHPIPKRIATKPSDDQNPVESPVLPERKKTSVVKLRPSSNSKASIPDTPVIIKCEVSRKAPIKREVSSPDSQNPVENEVVAEKKTKNKTSAVKLRPSPNSRPHFSDTPESVKRVVSSSSEKVGVSSKQASSKVKEPSLSAKRPTSSKPKSVLETSFSEKLATSLKPKSMMETSLSAKRATSLKPKSVMEKPLSSPGGLSGRRNSDIKIVKSTTSRVAVKKVLASPRAALSPKPSLVRVASLNARKHNSLKVVSSLKKVVSSLKNQNKIKKAEPDQPIDEPKQSINDVVQEKTLYVIKMETENKPLESDEKESPAVESSSLPLPSSPTSSSLPDSPSSSSRKEGHQEASDYTVTEAEDDSLSEHSETVNLEEAGTLEEEQEGRSRKVHPEDNDSEAVKLKFRRGKVVDVQSEHTSPRRLRFRRGRVLGENQNVKADGRGSFKRRGVVDGDTMDSKPGSVKVALRHQDVQGKKDAQGLFNNVIEETASKLVETRKSKVKALVGAFETVISLQERKPAANPVT